jgi:hypothetical protein
MTKEHQSAFTLVFMHLLTTLLHAQRIMSDIKPKGACAHVLA